MLPPPIDEPLAWTLLRAVTAADVTDRPSRAHHDRNPDVWLQVYPSGAWETSSLPSDAARQLLDLYIPLAISRDFVIAQLGQSLDGRIATASGHSHYVTGPDDIRRVHRLRALVDAVVVGAGTVDADDPQLTVRQAEGTDPARVVIDPSGRLDRGRRLFSDRRAPTWTVHRGEPGAAAPDGVIRCRPGADGAIAPGDIVRALRDRGLRRILIEGGGITVSRFLDAGVVDRLHVAVAPVLVGSGRASFTLTPITTLDQARRPACRIFRLGADVLFDLDVRTRAHPTRPGHPDI